MITLIYKLRFCGVLWETVDPRLIVVVRSVYCFSLKMGKLKPIDDSLQDAFTEVNGVTLDESLGVSVQQWSKQ